MAGAGWETKNAKRIRIARSIKLSMSLVWLIFNLLKYAEETDDKVAAISNKTNSNKANQDKLAVAYSISHAAFKPREIAGRSRHFVIPRNSRWRRTGNERGEVVVETEGKRSRPGADKEDFRQSVGKLAGSLPKANWTAKILELYRST